MTVPLPMTAIPLLPTRVKRVSWYGRCDECGLRADLGFRPGTDRRICANCMWPPTAPDETQMSAEVAIGLLFARSWAEMLERRNNNNPNKESR